MSSTLPLPSDDQRDIWHELSTQKLRARATKNLLAFTKFTMPRFHINWHHRVMCNRLDRFIRGEIPRLMVFMPPRSGKSELVSRRLPAFLFGVNPDETIISASYSDSLASMMNRDVQRIIDSQEYKNLFPSSTLWGENVRSDVRGSWLRNNDIFEIVGHRGRYRSAGIGSGITGLGGSTLIVDDPIKDQKEADSPTYRQNVWEWYTSTFKTRMENRDGKRGRILITLTRWHEDDLAGRLLAQAKSTPLADQWEVISFPAIREDLDNPYDPRAIGDALWPEAQPLDDLEKIKASSSRVWTALYQQRPSPESGVIIQREWFKYYRQAPSDFDTVVQSWDLTFKDGQTTDFVVGTVWGRVGANKYLLDMVRGQMSFTASIQAILAMSAKWPNATAKYVEEAANGAAAIDTLRNKVSGLIPVKPRTSKIARAQAVSPQFEAGNVWLPDPSLAPWVNDYVEEWMVFPNGRHDDQVDSSTQALLKLEETKHIDWAPVSITKDSYWGMGNYG